MRLAQLLYEKTGAFGLRLVNSPWDRLPRYQRDAWEGLADMVEAVPAQAFREVIAEMRAQIEALAGAVQANGDAVGQLLTLANKLKESKESEAQVAALTEALKAQTASVVATVAEVK